MNEEDGGKGKRVSAFAIGLSIVELNFNCGKYTINQQLPLIIICNQIIVINGTLGFNELHGHVDDQQGQSRPLLLRQMHK